VKHTPTFRLLYISAICLALLHFVFWLVDAGMYKPSLLWIDIPARFLLVWLLFELRNRQLWSSILMVIDLAIGPLMFYGWGLLRLRVLHLILMVCWALMGVFYYKLSSQDQKRRTGDQEALG
jgi:hypothetical protein